jgi:hypothetical protein
MTRMPGGTHTSSLNIYSLEEGWWYPVRSPLAVASSGQSVSSASRKSAQPSSIYFLLFDRICVDLDILWWLARLRECKL